MHHCEIFFGLDICIVPMRTLVISDIHNKIEVVQKFWTKNLLWMKLFLGDWFDDYNDTINDVANVAKFLNSIYTNEKFKFVWEMRFVLSTFS